MISRRKDFSFSQDEKMLLPENLLSDVSNEDLQSTSDKSEINIDKTNVNSFLFLFLLLN